MRRMYVAAIIGCVIGCILGVWIVLASGLLNGMPPALKIVVLALAAAAILWSAISQSRKRVRTYDEEVR